MKSVFPFFLLLTSCTILTSAAESRIRFGREQTKQFRVGFHIDASAGSVMPFVEAICFNSLFALV